LYYSFSSVRLFLGCFELRFDEGDEVSTSAEKGPCGDDDFAKGDEGQVHYDNGVLVQREIAWLYVTQIGAFYVGHPFVLAKFVMELSVPHVEAGRRLGPRLQQAIGETSCGCPEVQNVDSLDWQRKLVEEPTQLFSTSSHIGRRRFDSHFGVFGQKASGFVHPFSPDPNLPS
jgi:hypothetical protein